MSQRAPVSFSMEPSLKTSVDTFCCGTKWQLPYFSLCLPMLTLQTLLLNQVANLRCQLIKTLAFLGFLQAQIFCSVEILTQGPADDSRQRAIPVYRLSRKLQPTLKVPDDEPVI